MNYYERYVGDYGRDTGHLGLAEHGAYALLLDAYYANERPLPAAYDALYRICRAMSKAEQSAVRAVADEYFPVGQDGLRHQARADREITRAAPKILASRTNGKHGGRPRKNPTGFETETQQEPSGLRNQNPVGYPAETQPGEAFHQHHAPTPGSKAKVKPSCANADAFSRFWAVYPKKRSRGQAEKAWAKIGPVDELAEQIIVAAKRASQRPDWRKENGQYAPHPATWLNAKGWLDEEPQSATVGEEI